MISSGYPEDRAATGLIVWLRNLRRSAAPGEAPRQVERRQTARQRQLAAISAFLEDHGLEANATTLAVAHKYLTRTDAQLVRTIDRQVQADKPVTLAWLHEVTTLPPDDDELATLARLMTRLEASINEFARTSSEAHRATSEYHSALEEHVGELEQVNLAGEVIAELASIARVMLKRTRGIEKHMLRSEAQTRLLKRRLDEARRHAEEDMLTGLPNRRAFEARFEHEYRAARAAAQQLCVAFCDIDDFKLINDAHGHDAGDRVIRLVAEALTRLSDAGCHVARHGGEEFVVLFRDTAIDDAFDRLDQLRRQFADRRFVNRTTSEPFGQVTFSAGLADAFAYPDRREALRAADGALYRAKQAGKNRIEIALPANGAAAR